MKSYFLLPLPSPPLPPSFPVCLSVTGGWAIFPTNTSCTSCSTRWKNQPLRRKFRTATSTMFTRSERWDFPWHQLSSLDYKGRLSSSPHLPLRLVGWLVGFLTSSSTTRLYCGRAPRQSVWQFYVLPHMRQSWETMTSVSAGHIILTPTQPVGSGRPLRESNLGPPHQESRALPLSYRASKSVCVDGLQTFHAHSVLSTLTIVVCSVARFNGCTG